MRRPVPFLLAGYWTVAIVPGATAANLPLSMPFEYQNQIYLRVAVNRSPPMLFVLDSGAGGCVIDTATAGRLRLQIEGQRQGTGAGKGGIAVSFAKNVTYRLPGLSLSVPQSYVIDLSGQRTLQGRNVAGILGYDFFARYVVRLDFEAGVMTLDNPQTYAPPPKAAIVPFTLLKHTPHVSVRVKVEGRAPADHQVLVDTGSADAVDVDDLATAPKKLEVIGGVGLGEEFRTTLARAEWLEIGGSRLSGPVGATGGVELIGLEVLRRFNVTFDYPHTRIILLPNRHVAEPFAFDASGLDLRWTPDLKHLVIHDVAKGSVAAEAGLHTGEQIVSIDHQPAEAFRIDQVNQLLTEDGARIELGVIGSGRRREVTLQLRKRL